MAMAGIERVEFYCALAFSNRFVESALASQA
jgi:hypothetical protein